MDNAKSLYLCLSDKKSANVWILIFVCQQQQQRKKKDMPHWAPLLNMGEAVGYHWFKWNLEKHLGATLHYSKI